MPFAAESDCPSYIIDRDDGAITWCTKSRGHQGSHGNSQARATWIDSPQVELSRKRQRMIDDLAPLMVGSGVSQHQLLDIIEKHTIYR